MKTVGERRKFMGWSRGVDPRRFGDETGIWHARVEEQRGDVTVSFAACGERTPLSGQVEALPTGARVCQRIGCYAHSIRRTS